jgi:hypothetical protein
MARCSKPNPEVSMLKRSQQIRAVPSLAALAAVAGLAVVAPFAAAQSVPELPQASPLSRVEQRVGLTDFKVSYSSPGVKGREVWGALVPYGEIWRTGANAPTTLEASRDFRFGDKSVPAGTYALLTIPGKDQWTVLLNKDSKLPGGTRGYDEKQDAARITVAPEQAPARERMTFLFADTTDDATSLELEWGTLRIAIPVQVDTAAHAKASITEAVAGAWRPHALSARYLLESGGDLGEALGYADTSIEIEPTWLNNWVRAQILGKQGKPKDAIAAAEKSLSIGKEDPIFQQFFAPQVTKAIADWQQVS